MCLRRVKERARRGLFRQCVCFVVPGVARCTALMGLDFEEEDFGDGLVVVDLCELHQDLAYQSVCVRVSGICRSVEELEAYRVVYKDGDLCFGELGCQALVPDRLDDQKDRLHLRVED